jgi:glutamate N-acetyltransferase/amino-acid N-acetyltransferase
MAINGFRASAVASGMRYKDRLDLGLIVADRVQAAAGVFTRNVCQAAPVIWSRQRLRGARAILANSGQANAQSGQEGLEDCRLSAQALAGFLKVPANGILLASTGIIGPRLNLPAMTAAMPGLVSSLSPDGLGDFARAIMTTDTRPKEATAQAAIPGGPDIGIWGAAKGSGMIAPNMATMLGFVLTDAAIEQDLLDGILRRGAEASFNRVTVDGDTSTNDSLFLLASGTAGGPPISGGPGAKAIEEAILGVLLSLARQIAKDGEGATRLVEVSVIGALDDPDARKAARTVAESPLVKTAFFGADANWGRIMAALGRSGASFDPYKVDLDLDDVPWVRSGQDNGRDQAASRVMGKPEYRLLINLNAGQASHSVLTCDLSHDYVSINGSYRS